MNLSFTFVKDTVNYPLSFRSGKTFCLAGENCISLFDSLFLFVLFYGITSDVFLKEDIAYLISTLIDYARVFFGSSLKGKRCSEFVATLYILIPIKMQ